MDFDFVKKYIDIWDPIDLLSHAPSDEYDEESAKISNLLKKGNDLGKVIFEIFNESFGSQSFSKTLAECEELAQQMIKDFSQL